MGEAEADVMTKRLCHSPKLDGRPFGLRFTRVLERCTRDQRCCFQMIASYCLAVCDFSIRVPRGLVSRCSGTTWVFEGKSNFQRLSGKCRPACIEWNSIRQCSLQMSHPCERMLRNSDIQTSTIVSSPPTPTPGSSITPLPRPSSNSLLTSGPICLCPLTSSKSNSASR